MYRIKEFSQKTNVSPHTIRYYEKIGVLPNAHRKENGYRIYSDADVDRLQFVSRARQLDFPLENISEIIAFREQGTPPCTYVQELITAKITEVKSRILELEALRDELVALDEVSKTISTDNPETPCICQIIETDVTTERKETA